MRMKCYLEIEIEIDAEYIPAQPGKHSGPFEECYPDTPEEISFVVPAKTQFEAWDILQSAINSNQESIEDQIRDHFIAEKERFESSKAEYIYEHKRWLENE